MMPRRAALLGTLLALLGSSAPAQPQPRSALEQLARGDTAYQAFDVLDALAHYEAAAGSDSLLAAAWGKASRSAVDLGESEQDATKRKYYFQKGVNYARRAVSLEPTVAEWHFALARALGRLALSVGVRERVRYAVEIRDQALQALRLEPDHPGALHVLGMWHAEVRRLNGLERFVAQNFLGGRIFQEASWEEAVRLLERAVAVDPERLVHRLDLAKIYADIGAKAKARAQYEVVVGAQVRTDYNDPLYKRQAAEELRRLR
jgi:tetratricopeptide (TPR) repeat protein